MDPKVAANLGAAFIMSIGTITPAYAIGMGVRAAMESIGRNPEAADRLFTPMIVGLGLAEAVAIYCLVTALALIFVGGG
jgi:F-type H+-transporting ATPase subunit c